MKTPDGWVPQRRRRKRQGLRTLSYVDCDAFYSDF